MTPLNNDNVRGSLLSNTGVAIIDEIMNSELSTAYVELSAEIAECKTMLGSTRGFFWKRPAYTAQEQARATARLKLLEVAQSQIASQIAGGDRSTNLTIKIAQKQIDL